MLFHISNELGKMLLHRVLVEITGVPVLLEKVLARMMNSSLLSYSKFFDCVWFIF
jgi:hypothetical protein